MATVSRVEPTRLDGYDRSKKADEQDPRLAIPPAFCDAMVVREKVFVEEQQVPLECEHDEDDARSWHWVLYAPAEEGKASPDGPMEPVGTMRVVPYPHSPHPEPGGRYVDNKLVEGGAGQEATPPTRPPGVDRATTFHDGREPYVKIGRMAVIPRCRGRRMADHLWAAASKWLEEHPGSLEPDMTRVSGQEIQAGREPNPPRWNGLICLHAQDRPGVVKTYQRWGFNVDEEMGRWHEEGIPHVGMFTRLPLKPAAA